MLNHTIYKEINHVALFGYRVFERLCLNVRAFYNGLFAKAYLFIKLAIDICLLLVNSKVDLNQIMIIYAENVSCCTFYLHQEIMLEVMMVEL